MFQGLSQQTDQSLVMFLLRWACGAIGDKMWNQGPCVMDEIKSVASDPFL